jgi:hypothetical protein
VNLSVLENSGTQGVDQTSPSVDSNGSHFVLAYSEKVPAFGYYDLYATDLILSGSEIRVAQSHVLAYNISLPVLNAQVAAASANSPIAQSFLIPFDIEQNSTDHDCTAVVFGSLVGGITTPYCFGDGTGTACPCGNSGAAGHGCAHSASSTGASLLKIGGIESVASDSLFLQAQSLPSGAPVLFFQGTLPTAGSAFGDGLLCLGGTIVRLGVVFATGTNAFAPAGLAALGGVPAGGGRRAYQAWYRDASPAHCSSSTFNLTNGVQVDWIP